MLNPQRFAHPLTSARRLWDARLASRMVAPLAESWVTPNHLTTLRLGVGLCAAAAFVPGRYGWSNIAALLLVLSNFLDHADGELARLSGKTSRTGHWYDLASDALVTILLFIAIGVGLSGKPGMDTDMALLSVLQGASSVLLGIVAGTAIALIFFLRMRIEELHGKHAAQQASLGGFETEDVLYLFPLATLSDALAPTLLVASICAPLYAVWVVIDYQRAVRRNRRMAAGIAG